MSTQPSTPTNAFAVLMMGPPQSKVPPSRKGARPRPRRPSGPGCWTPLVPCPAGCGKRMRENDANAHLDRCLGACSDASTTTTTSHGSVARIATSSQSQPPVTDSPSSQPQANRASASGRIFLNRLQGSCCIPKKRRVICPACDKSLPTSLINLHLDQCVRSNHGTKDLPEHFQCAEQPIRINAAREATVTTTSTTKSEAAIALSLDEDDDDSVISNESLKDPPYPNDHVGVITEVTVRPKSNVDGTFEVVESSVHKGESQSASSLDVNIAKSATTPTTPKPQDAAATVSSQKKSPDSEQKPSIFATMMKESQSALAREKATTLPISFHLDDQMGVTLHLGSTQGADQTWTRPSWTARIQIRDRFHRGDSAARSPPPPLTTLAVTLSSSVPSHTATTTVAAPVRRRCWVRQHSRLSVPVLKSILQKSIRRRRPLPAVKVAMELADKSLGDLLRRLPVIVLEDSMLHPDLDFLTWIMMAHSKDFTPPPRLLLRVFQIVYEVASCQYSDSLPVETKEEEEIGNNVTTLTSLSTTTNPTAASSTLSKEAAIVWSILVRAEYGGMKGDVQMLQDYAQLWNQRFATVHVSDAIADRLTGSVADSSTRSYTWANIPSRIHQSARKQSTARVTLTCTNGIDRLVFEDICLEGVDFHCSSVIDELLVDRELCGICHDLMVLSGADAGDIPDSVEGRRRRLEGILKHCMWTLSSGVNLRRPLGLDLSASSSSKDKYKELWSELISPRALAYQKKYVEQRLA